MLEYNPDKRVTYDELYTFFGFPTIEKEFKKPE
jgi:hypothetical protein